MNTNTTTFKLKISKLFNSSFKSCRTKHTSDDVSGHPFFFPENHHHHRQLIDLFSPKPQHPLLLSSFSRRSKPTFFSRQKLSGENFPAPGKSKNPNSGKKKKTHHRKTIKFQDFASVTDNYYYDFCSSDDDDDIDDDDVTLFSSKSFSSDSSKSKNRIRRKKIKNSGAGAGGGGGVGVGAGGGGGCKGMKLTDVIPINGIGKLVNESVAVVKKSTDPYGDFRVSMLEMIVERQIVGAQDLEDLLKCFLTLNSEEHHKVICEVFTEIWETFSD